MGVQILNKDVSLISSITGIAKANIANVGGVTGWTGGGADVIPNPTPNWGDIGYNGVTGIFDYRQAQIQGISSNITLKLTYNENTVGEIYYYITTDANYITTISDVNPPTGQPDSFTRILSSDSLVVSNGEYIIFGLESNFATGTESIQVLNNSDGNTLLDTFNATNTEPV